MTRKQKFYVAFVIAIAVGSQLGGCAMKPLPPPAPPPNFVCTMEFICITKCELKSMSEESAAYILANNRIIKSHCPDKMCPPYSQSRWDHDCLKSLMREE